VSRNQALALIAFFSAIEPVCMHRFVMRLSYWNQCCVTCEFNDRPLNHVFEPTTTVFILSSDQPGQGSDEFEVGVNMLILPLSFCEAAAGIGWKNDCDIKEHWTYSGGR
jgi:hypothetical protein